MPGKPLKPQSHPLTVVRDPKTLKLEYVLDSYAKHISGVRSISIKTEEGKHPVMTLEIIDFDEILGALE